MKQTIRKHIHLLALMTIPLFFIACPTIHVSQHEQFPTELFEAAQARIAVLQAANPDRDREAIELRMLVYDGDGGELVEIHMPLAIVEWGMDVSKETIELDPDSNWEEDLNPIAHMRPEDLRKLGPGMLVQVEDAEDDAHVLIWLE